VFYVDFRYFCLKYHTKLKKENRLECFLKQADVSSLERNGTNVTLTETLRKYPPLTCLNRECTKDYPIPGTHVTLEKGTQVIIPVEALQHDPQYFPEPDKFDPERFSEETKSGRHHYVYLPFGEGPRICIGKYFTTHVTP